METLRQKLEGDGFALVPRAIGDEKIAEIIAGLKNAARENGDEVCRRGEVFAMRNVLQTVPAAREIVPSLRAFVEPILGAGAFAVRAILFDKTPGANWKVPPHQDLTIAVRDKRDAPGFSGWSEKAGVLHVQPPLEILENMLTLRLHLDNCDENNAPLQIVPGSHLWGKIDSQEITARRAGHATVSCVLPRGGALLMRPLILHCSSAAKTATHRRVLHIEWASEELPHGLKWHEKYA